MASEATARITEPQTDPTAAPEEGLAHHRAGRFEDAVAIYWRVLDNIPGQPNAPHLLGLVEIERGNPSVCAHRQRVAGSAARLSDIGGALAQLRALAGSVA